MKTTCPGVRAHGSKSRCVERSERPYQRLLREQMRRSPAPPERAACAARQESAASPAEAGPGREAPGPGGGPLLLALPGFWRPPALLGSRPLLHCPSSGLPSLCFRPSFILTRTPATDHTGPTPYTRIIFLQGPPGNPNPLGSCLFTSRMRVGVGAGVTTRRPRPLPTPPPRPRETARQTGREYRLGVFSPNLGDEGMTHPILGAAPVATPRAEEPVGMGTAQGADR